MGAKKLDQPPLETSAVTIINTTLSIKQVPYMAADLVLTITDTHLDMPKAEFMPGLNMPMSSEVWEIVRQNNACREWIAAEYLVEAKGLPLTASKRDCTELIENSACLKAMRWWLKEEKRATIRKLLKDKIRAMTKGFSKENEPED